MDTVAFRKWCCDNGIFLTWEQLLAVEDVYERALVGRGTGKTFLKCLMAIYRAGTEGIHVFYVIKETNYYAQVANMMRDLADKIDWKITNHETKIIVNDGRMQGVIHIIAKEGLDKFRIPYANIEICDL